MALLTNIVAAEEDELEAVGESLHPIDEWSGIERRGIDIAKVVMLHCLLVDDDFDLATTYYEPVYVNSDGGLVLRFADELLERLAALDEEGLERTGMELAATDTFEYEGWEAAEVEELVMELGELAQLAESQGQVIYVWMYPLMT